MKFNQLPNLPFIINKRHIYNKLSDKLINSLDLGWTSMDLELHSQLFCGESKVDGVTEFDIKKIKLEDHDEGTDDNITLLATNLELSEREVKMYLELNNYRDEL